MATWVRNGTGTYPSATNADVTGTMELDNGTAPADFDPADINSVRIQYDMEVTSGTFTSPEDHTVLRNVELTINGVGSALASVDGTNTDISTSNISTDETDSVIASGPTTANWEGAELNPGDIGGARNWTTFNQNMGPDGVLISVASSPNVVVTIDYNPGLTHYTIDCDVGVYTISGVTADLLAKPRVDTAVGAYAVSGISADLTYTPLTHYTLDCDPGAYVVGGVTADLFVGTQVDCAVGSYSIAGVTADLLAKTQIETAVGVYTIGGVDADLTYDGLTHYTLDCDPGVYTIAGIGADLLTGTQVDATAGVYTISGVSADLLATSLIDTAVGSYAIGGVSADLLADTLIDTAVGAYTVSGIDADLQVDSLVDTAVGAYVVSGIEADLQVDWLIDADVGAYVVLGVAADLSSSSSGGTIPGFMHYYRKKREEAL